MPTQPRHPSMREVAFGRVHDKGVASSRPPFVDTLRDGCQGWVGKEEIPPLPIVDFHFPPRNMISHLEISLLDIKLHQGMTTTWERTQNIFSSTSCSYCSCCSGGAEPPLLLTPGGDATWNFISHVESHFSLWNFKSHHGMSYSTVALPHVDDNMETRPKGQDCALSGEDGSLLAQLKKCMFPHKEEDLLLLQECSTFFVPETNRLLVQDKHDFSSNHILS